MFTRLFLIYHIFNSVTCVVAWLVFICDLLVEDLGHGVIECMISGPSWLVAGGDA